MSDSYTLSRSCNTSGQNAATGGQTLQHKWPNSATQVAKLCNTSGQTLQHEVKRCNTSGQTLQQEVKRFNAWSTLQQEVKHRSRWSNRVAALPEPQLQHAVKRRNKKNVAKYNRWSNSARSNGA